MKFNIQSAALRFTALALAAVMAVLLVSSIQAIARVDFFNGFQASRPSTSLLAELPQPSKPFHARDWQNLLSATSSTAPKTATSSKTARAETPSYAPPQQVAFAHPTNYGNRYTKDIYGKPVRNAPIIVLHETVGSADSALNTFQTPHYNEDDQVSYHSLIRRDGTIVYVVPPEKRAFGAGNSAFKGLKGLESVKTHHHYPPSVNNFAYHISLESPADNDSNASSHSGYTEAQYQSLAWLIAQTGIPDNRIATHRGVDRSGSRFDPRSFDGRKFFSYLHNYPRLSVGTSSR